MRLWWSLRRLFARRDPHPARWDRSHEEMESVRERQRDIRVRAEALGIKVDVLARREGEGRGAGDGTVPR